VNAGPPAFVLRAVEAAWGEAVGRRIRMAGAEPVGGGCISRVARLRAEDGSATFLKWSEPAAGMFDAEAEGLQALAATGAVRVPAVLARGRGWLLLEWLEASPAGDLDRVALGRSVAALHRARGHAFGWERDNFIGPLTQENGRMPAWPAFWSERRLRPQLRRAVDAGALEAPARSRCDRLLDDLDARIGDPAALDGPSLLHGDLWSGNVVPLPGGGAALVDPAVYHGHREVDLAMADLFGGFGPAFHGGYAEVWPLGAGYVPVRRAVYQLYYLLVHLNLFGRGYRDGVLAALAEAGV
jgi:fructosamine-3-kinase